jgi:hypothetical protein
LWIGLFNDQSINVVARNTKLNTKNKGTLSVINEQGQDVAAMQCQVAVGKEQRDVAAINSITFNTFFNVRVLRVEDDDAEDREIFHCQVLREEQNLQGVIANAKEWKRKKKASERKRRDLEGLNEQSKDVVREMHKKVKSGEGDIAYWVFKLDTKENMQPGHVVALVANGEGYLCATMHPKDPKKVLTWTALAGAKGGSSACLDK